MRSEVRILSGAVMFIKIFTSGPIDTHSYLIACPETKEAAVIDAPQGVTSSVLEEVKRQHLTVKMVLITHSHWDHTADAAELKKSLEVPLYIQPLDEPNLIRPGSDGLPLYFPIEGVKADGFLKEGDVLHVGTLKIKVIETPGHSPGGVSLWIPKEKVLFSGDTLFQGTMGRVDFPMSNRLLMWESLKKLAKLPPETKVYPGHGPSTTIGAEAWISKIGDKDANW